MLKHVHTRLEEVQQQIQQLLPSDAILIGHSLNFDLDALQVSVLSMFDFLVKITHSAVPYEALLKLSA